MSLVAVAIALVVGLPIALWLGHKRRFGWLAINVSNVGRAVPSFAILVFGAQIWGISTWWGIPNAALVALIALGLATDRHERVRRHGRGRRRHPRRGAGAWA